MTTPKSFFEEKLPSNLAKDPSGTASIDAIYQFNVDGDDGGTWVVDLTKDADWVSSGASDDAQCTINIAGSDLVDIVEGRLNGMQAFMMGKLKIEGDMGLAMKLGNILGG